MEPPKVATWEFADLDTPLNLAVEWIINAPAEPWGIVIPLPHPILEAGITKFFSVQIQTIAPFFHVQTTRMETAPGASQYTVYVHQNEQDGASKLLARGELRVFLVNEKQTEVWFIPHEDSHALHSPELFLRMVRTCLQMLLVEQFIASVRRKKREETNSSAITQHQSSLPAVLPDPPDPAVESWEAVFDWYEEYGKAHGITSDKELARAIMRDHQTVRNQRSLLGRSHKRRRKRSGQFGTSSGH